ncbi:unnamed protein product [Sphenostylis stenocarpa]|uniref:EF-hand domain-containing protein n=1 Tax=Sphenostylis stenocarpa TaxID=92480 RepID=A0AA86VHM1_9FABA|nr:unnamed protein product [Sphenostylis stenocarpa]
MLLHGGGWRPMTAGMASFDEFTHDDNSGREFETFVKVVSSGILIVGSTLGFLYWSSFSSHDTSSVGPSGDSANKDQLQQKPRNKPSKFLFNGALIFINDLHNFRRRVFFNYEKRIRLQSPPEKVFEYFASVQTPSGEVFMTPADLMRAIVPVFPPSESNRVREGFLLGEQSEYLLETSVITTSEEIDKQEFKKVMALMRSQNRQGATHRNGRRLGIKTSVENGGLLEYFFGEHGTSCLQHERFVQFLRELHEEILRLEFSHYDYKKKGTISAKDFALSLVASADVNHIRKLLDRVEELNKDQQLRDSRLTYKEFQSFAELRKKLQPFSLAIFSYGKVNGVLTKTDFQRAASQVCGVDLTDKVVDIIFHLFDANRDGNLSVGEFVRVVERGEGSSSVSSTTASFRESGRRFIVVEMEICSLSHHG